MIAPTRLEGPTGVVVESDSDAALAWGAYGALQNIFCAAELPWEGLMRVFRRLAPVWIEAYWCERRRLAGTDQGQTALDLEVWFHSHLPGQADVGAGTERDHAIRAVIAAAIDRLREGAHENHAQSVFEFHTQEHYAPPPPEDVERLRLPEAIRAGFAAWRERWARVVPNRRR